MAFGEWKMALLPAPPRLTMGVVYTMYDALVSINVPTEKAKAVIDAMEREMMDKIATKSDVEHVRELLAKDMQNLSYAMTAKLGTISVVSAGMLFALLKLT
jgi:hypothetical protein